MPLLLRLLLCVIAPDRVASIKSSETLSRLMSHIEFKALGFGPTDESCLIGGVGPSLPYFPFLAPKP